MTQYLLNALGFDDEWKTALKALVNAFPACPGVATIEAMGFPADWQTLDLWT